MYCVLRHFYAISDAKMLELLHRLIHGIVRHMDIAIHGGLDACVAQQLLQNLRLHSAFDGTGGVSMTQSVHAEPFDSSLVTQLDRKSVV